MYDVIILLKVWHSGEYAYNHYNTSNTLDFQKNIRTTWLIR